MKKLVFFCSLLIVLAALSWLAWSYKLFSSKKNSSETYSNIRIVFDPVTNPHVDGVAIFPFSVCTNNHTAWDSSRNRPVLYFDSVKNGTVTLNVLSRYGGKYTRQLNLQNDTLINLSPFETPFAEYANASEMSLTGLNKGETLGIVYSTSGCFSSYYEKLYITKVDTGYEVEIIPSRNSFNKNYHTSIMKKRFDDSFSIILESFLRKTSELLERKPTDFYSTTSHGLHINRKGRVYTFYEPELSYQKFLTSIGLQ